MHAYISMFMRGLLRGSKCVARADGANGACQICSSVSIDFPCECEHNIPGSLDARLFPSVVLAVAPAVTMDEASSLSVCIHRSYGYVCIYLSLHARIDICLYA